MYNLINFILGIVSFICISLLYFLVNELFLHSVQPDKTECHV